MTEALDRFQREAGQKERLSSLGRLSTVIAHEIRNPLMIVKAALRTLRDESASALDRREALADIDGEVARLNRLVNDVLDFARPLSFAYAEADVNEVCRGAVAAAFTGESGGQPRLLLDAGLPAIVTDAERLRLALVNVLTNARHAVQAAREGWRDAPSALPEDASWLELATSQPAPGRVAIEVRDRGRGIAADDLRRVFEPYFTTRRGGTGLGLAIVKNIVEGLGGSVAIASRPGGGSEVRVELPERPAAAAAEGPGRPAAAPGLVAEARRGERRQGGRA